MSTVEEEVIASSTMVSFIALESPSGRSTGFEIKQVDFDSWRLPSEQSATACSSRCSQ